MKGILAFGFFMLFLAGIALVNLGGGGSAGTADSWVPERTELVAERWQLVALRGEPGARSAGIEMQLTPGGLLTGHSRCRHFTGRYVLDNAMLEFSEVGVLPRDCPGPVSPAETAFLDSLAETSAVVTNGQHLVLLSADGQRLARFVPQLPPRD